jgi:hypothetical protein
MKLTTLYLLLSLSFCATAQEATDTLPYEQYFEGVARKTAKTNISKGKLYTYASVGEFLKSLPSDEDMLAKNIKDNSRRLPEEEKNILIEEAYLFSIEMEDDKDLHLLIGDIIDSTKTNLLTVEVSALPDRRNPNYTTLLEVRKILYDEYPKCFSGKRVRPNKKFRPVKIKGSLFFDNRHPATGKAHRPQTAFELHPITLIEFL